MLRRPISAIRTVLICLLFPAFAALPVPAAFAATGGWTSTSVRGVVVYLLDGKWQEVDRGQQINEATLRTLRGGRLSLESQSITLNVGPNSALQIGTKGGTSNVVQQYEGSVDVAIASGAAPFTVRAGSVTLTKITGELSISMTDNATSLVIKTGTVAVASAGGHRASLGPGVYQTDASGVLASQSDAVAAEDVPAATDVVPRGAINANANANSNAGGNGGSNAGGGGNAGGNGNGGGSGGGGGNGGGGGSGNGGGNGSGGGSGSGGGNGDGGGNGNGKNK